MGVRAKGDREAGGDEVEGSLELGDVAFRWGLEVLLAAPVLYLLWSQAQVRGWGSWRQGAAALLFFAGHALLLARLGRRLCPTFPGPALGLVAAAAVVATPVAWPAALVFRVVEGASVAAAEYRAGTATGGNEWLRRGRSLAVDPVTRFPTYRRYRCSRAGYSARFDNPWYRTTLVALSRAFGPNPAGYAGPFPTREQAHAWLRDEGGPVDDGELQALFPEGVEVDDRGTRWPPELDPEAAPGLGPGRPAGAALAGRGGLAGRHRDDAEAPWVELYVVPEGTYLGAYAPE